MSFSGLSIEDFIPSYFSPDIRERLKTGLSDFFYKGSERDKDYTGFYALDAPNYLMQSDVLQSVRTIDWDDDTRDYVLCYFPSMIISNTCDITEENIRTTNIKQALLAPLIPVHEYLNDLRIISSEDQILSFYNALKKQEFSNLFYLPANHKNGLEYLVCLDKIYWHPSTALNTLTEDINNHRYLSLSNWGFYLFLLKLSYHLCRLPEEYDGRKN